VVNLSDGGELVAGWLVFFFKKEECCSFLKKRTKRLLLSRAGFANTGHGRTNTFFINGLTGRVSGTRGGVCGSLSDVLHTGAE
jgi:hypothetical protein